mmetsp:Transcript_9585/g.27174  ORF Transcript_9585/g.27174 Transcript_9585/m.27174 type:complete len:217 (-) Transcript_9585:925-1575(-)
MLPGRPRMGEERPRHLRRAAGRGARGRGRRRCGARPGLPGTREATGRGNLGGGGRRYPRRCSCPFSWVVGPLLRPKACPQGRTATRGNPSLPPGWPRRCLAGKSSPSLDFPEPGPPPGRLRPRQLGWRSVGTTVRVGESMVPQVPAPGALETAALSGSCGVPSARRLRQPQQPQRPWPLMRRGTPTPGLVVQQRAPGAASRHPCFPVHCRQPCEPQ